MHDTFRWDKLSAHEAAVLRIISAHRGVATAMSVGEVARAANLHSRVAQDVVKGLIEVHGVPVGTSSSSTRPGWYLCATAEELSQNREALRHRALSVLRRAKAFDPRRIVRLAELYCGQVPLPLGRRHG